MFTVYSLYNDIQLIDLILKMPRSKEKLLLVARFRYFEDSGKISLK